MKVYFIALFFSLLAQIVPANTSKQYIWRLFFSFLPIFLYGVLRSTIGDGVFYEEEFYAIHNATDIFNVNEHYEPGYVILNKIIPTYRGLIIFITTLMCFSYAFVFYRIVKPNNLWLAIILLYLLGGNTFYFVLGSYRNGIGLCIFMLSMPLLQQRKLIPYLLLTVLAGSIHTSMFFSMGLAYLVTIWKGDTKNESIFWIVAVLFFVISSGSSLLNMITPYVNQYVDRWDPCIQALQEGAGHKGGLNYLASISMLLFIGSMMKSHEWGDDFKCICRLALFFCLANIMGPLSGRNPQCFCLFFISVVAEFLTRIKDNKFRIPFITFVMLYSAYFYYIFITSQWSEKHLVYHSILGGF